MKNKNKKLLDSFAKFCKEFPEFRFWQALTVWVKVTKIYVQKYSKIVDDEIVFDTWEFKNKNK